MASSSADCFGVDRHPARLLLGSSVGRCFWASTPRSRRSPGRTPPPRRPRLLALGRFFGGNGGAAASLGPGAEGDERLRERGDGDHRGGRDPGRGEGDLAVVLVELELGVVGVHGHPEPAELGDQPDHLVGLRGVEEHPVAAASGCRPVRWCRSGRSPPTRRGPSSVAFCQVSGSGRSRKPQRVGGELAAVAGPHPLGGEHPVPRPGAGLDGHRSVLASVAAVMVTPSAVRVAREDGREGAAAVDPQFDRSDGGPRGSASLPRRHRTVPPGDAAGLRLPCGRPRTSSSCMVTHSMTGTPRRRRRPAWVAAFRIAVASQVAIRSTVAAVGSLVLVERAADVGDEPAADHRARRSPPSSWYAVEVQPGQHLVEQVVVPVGFVGVRRSPDAPREAVRLHVVLVAPALGGELLDRQHDHAGHLLGQSQPVHQPVPARAGTARSSREAQ